MEVEMFFKAALLTAVLLAQFTPITALAEGSCPRGFHLEAVMPDHEHDPDHKHVGTSADRNGDGLICVKHVTPGGSIHVHIDNNLP
jgi:hypothetical protein